MTTLYLIRHGQSEGNKIRSFLGHTDLPLTDLGHMQAEKTANYLNSIKADAIYSSDLLRAYQTACHTADKQGLPIIKDCRFREIFAGDWEGVLFDELLIRYPESYASGWKTDIGNAYCDNGESVAELKYRIVAAMTDVAIENDGKTVFIFTHATPLRAFATYCNGNDLNEMKNIPWASNASVTKVEYDGAFTLVEYGNDSFMGELTSTLPKNV